ncbi:uncharacterized protein LOC126843087 [Adelges cooleyi]|uniref:uncharacterized protein LOC126843087 n=1 Tax=Adelges cooleyi TaxID=133065 RepID=UPI00217FB652|nr:uncharacterized protein LOC126843087 [Adelges cooleyi]XP_050436356.1 uncharacterized protein LOC126843087 [Adelges cooleyi]XP_050436358.1 uncharacterized protein LOC126843087 [Adelges cooleyi]
MIRVKEKIRYDVNVHREKNKLILLNARRGITFDENDDKNDTFTIQDVHNIALEIKKKKTITRNHLKLLKHAFLNGQEFILEFFRVQGAFDSLLHYTSSNDDALQLAAFECFCNMSLGDNKTCIKLAKLITPYLMVHINSLNFNISSISIWTLGNISDSSETACVLLQNQNFFEALVNCLKNSTCDEVIQNTFYALKLMLKTYISQLKIEILNDLLQTCLERSKTWKESFWIIYQISCRQDFALHDDHLMRHLLNSIHSDDELVDIKFLIPILRTFGNIIALDQSNNSANTFLFALKSQGPIIRHILIQNKSINLSNECAWLLGNVFNSLHINNFNDNNVINADYFEEVCSYFFV